MDEQNQKKPATLSVVPSANSTSITPAHDRHWREQVATLVEQCYAGLRVYGKSPDQVANAVKLFCLVLASHPIKKIQMAFRAYLENHSELPTPSDIVGYIRRDGRKPMDRSLYIALCQKRQQTAWSDGPYPWQKGDGLSDEETAYIRDYERFETAGDVKQIGGV